MSAKKRKMFAYTEEQMEHALQDVALGMSVASAAKKYNVPRITLLYKSKGQTPRERRMGPQSCLFKEEEHTLVKWILASARAGFPVTNSMVLDSVQQMIRKTNRPNPFTNDRPGRTWLANFFKRNPSISSRVSQNLTISRGTIKETDLCRWYDEVFNYLKANGHDDILQNPTRVFNGDETAFFLNPKGKKVLARKGDKTVYQIVNADEKECITVLITANASGQLAPPLVVFKYERIPADIAESVPPGWGTGKSESGWMNCSLFYEFIANIFHPWIVQNNIQRPVILFIDGHTSHLSWHTSTFCNGNGIILVALYPNATHLIQPMDVAVFRSLKENWKTAVHEWRVQNHQNPTLRKRDFSPLLKSILDTKLSSQIISNGFKKTGLVPWNPEAVIIPLRQNHCNMEDVENRIVHDIGTKKMNTAVSVLESYIGKQKLQVFKNKSIWTGDLEDKSLFEIWRRMKDAAKAKEYDSTIEGSLNSTEGLDSNTYGLSIEMTTTNSASIEESIDVCELPIQEDIVPDEVPTANKSFPKDIPSPFKNVLFWPEPPEKKKIYIRERMPSVITSDKWLEYHNNKNKKRREAEETKKKNAQRRLEMQKIKAEEKLQMKKAREEKQKQRIKDKQAMKKTKRHKKKLPSTSSETEEEWIPSCNESQEASSSFEEIISNYIHSTGSNFEEEVTENADQEKQKIVDTEQEEIAHVYPKVIILRKEEEPKKTIEQSTLLNKSNNQLDEPSNEAATVGSSRIMQEGFSRNEISGVHDIQEGAYVLVTEEPSEKKPKPKKCVGLVQNIINTNKVSILVLHPMNRLKTVFSPSNVTIIACLNSITPILTTPVVFGEDETRRIQFCTSIGTY